MDIMSYLMGQNSAIKKGMHVEVVTELPTTGVSNVVYLVPKQDTGDNDIFDEYLWVDDDWEHIGSTDIDLSNYYTKSEVDSKLPPYYEIDVRISGDSLVPTGTVTFKSIINDAYQKGFDNILISIKPATYTYNILCNYSFGRLQSKPTRIDAYCVAEISNNTFRNFMIIYTLAWSGDTCYSASARLASDISNMYLSTDNTASFTPTSDYNPATKKYVDDITGALSSLDTTDKTSLVNAINELAGSSGSSSYPMYNLKTSNTLDIIINPDETIYPADDAPFIDKATEIINDMYFKEFDVALVNLYSLNTGSKFSIPCSTCWADISTKPSTICFIGTTFIDHPYPNGYLYSIRIDINGSWSGDTFTTSYITLHRSKNYFQDGIASKNYVDNSIASAITDALGGSY